MATFILPHPTDDPSLMTIEMTFGLLSPLSWTEGGLYEQGTYGGVTAIMVHSGTLDDGVPIVVARTGRAQRLRVYPESHNVSPGEVSCSIFEGQPVLTHARLYWSDGSMVHRDDVASVERWLFDVSGRQPIHLATDRVDPRRCLYTSLQTWEVDTYGFQFENEVDGAWFEGSRAYLVEWVLERNSRSRERLPLLVRVAVKSLQSQRSKTFGRRTSS